MIAQILLLVAALGFAYAMTVYRSEARVADEVVRRWMRHTREAHRLLAKSRVKHAKATARVRSMMLERRGEGDLIGARPWDVAEGEAAKARARRLGYLLEREREKHAKARARLAAMQGERKRKEANEGFWRRVCGSSRQVTVVTVQLVPCKRCGAPLPMEREGRGVCAGCESSGEGERNEQRRVACALCGERIPPAFVDAWTTETNGLCAACYHGEG